MGIPTLRTCHFEASENIMTKFKSQATRAKHFGPKCITKEKKTLDETVLNFR